MEEGAPLPDLLNAGLQLFNEGFFFEAHEVWEELWRGERGDSRLFLQGLIQVAAGFHHFKNGNSAGALALFDKALAKLRRYPGTTMNIDVADLIDAVTRARTAIASGEPVPGSPDVGFPRIRLRELRG